MILIKVLMKYTRQKFSLRILRINCLDILIKMGLVHGRYVEHCAIFLCKDCKGFSDGFTWDDSMADMLSVLS